MSFSFIQNPTGDSLTGADLVSSALDQPMSLGSTFWDQAKGGVLESFGLGTAIREAQLPAEAPTTPDMVFTPPEGEGPVRVPDTPQMRRRITAYEAVSGQTVQSRRETPQELETRQQEAGAFSEDAYKTSPSFREDIPWQNGMTADRAAALASQDDMRKVRQFYAAKRPITSFFGNLGGQAIDPINYIPVAGEAVAAANTLRFGRIAGRAITGALDAAGNTAAAALLTAPTRAKLGDDVSFQSTISQIAMAAVIGGAFGAVAGRFGRETPSELRVHAEEKLATLQNVQEARVALNDALDGMIHRGEVSVSHVTTDAVSRVADVELPAVSINLSSASFAPDAVSEFTTAKGSLYAVNQDGTTIRNKAARDDVGHEGDSGVKAATQKTIYVDENAAVLSSAGLNGIGSKGSRVILRDGKASLLTWNEPKQAWGASDGSRDIPFHTEPAVGRYPLELWKNADDVQGYEAYGRMHAGNAITEVRERQKTPETKEAPAAPLMGSPTPVADLGVTEAKERVSRPEATRDVAEQFRVDPETGAFPEQADIDQLIAEGRVTDEDRALLDEADATMKSANAYGEAVKSFANCVI